MEQAPISAEVEQAGQEADLLMFEKIKAVLADNTKSAWKPFTIAMLGAAAAGAGLAFSLPVVPVLGAGAAGIGMFGKNGLLARQGKESTFKFLQENVLGKTYEEKSTALEKYRKKWEKIRKIGETTTWVGIVGIIAGAAGIFASSAMPALAPVLLPLSVNIFSASMLVTVAGAFTDAPSQKRLKTLKEDFAFMRMAAIQEMITKKIEDNKTSQPAGTQLGQNPVSGPFNSEAAAPSAPSENQPATKKTFTQYPRWGHFNRK